MDLAFVLAVQHLLVVFGRLEGAGSLLRELPEQGRWLWSASAWIGSPSHLNPTRRRRTDAARDGARGVAGLAHGQSKGSRVNDDMGTTC